MGSNTADISVVDAVPASDSATKRLTGDERRREILDAVRTVSSELGVSHLSVSAVTKRAGCTRSLFYHYFADMDAAVTAVMDEAIDGFISELEQWNASRTVGDIEGALDTIAPLFKRLVASGPRAAEHPDLQQRRALRWLFAQRGPARGTVYLRHHRGGFCRPS